MTGFAGIELGGTKVVIAFGTGPGDISQRVRIATTTPSETLAEVTRLISERIKEAGLVGIGIASFGPIGLDRALPDFGRILKTPKPNWSGADIVGPLSRFGVPIGLATDVGAAALAEGRWGACRGLSDHAYVTVGTGVGVGAVVNTQLVRGVLHPEAGHISVRHDRRADPFEGVCPFHGDCLEGLVSGPAIAARLGRQGEEVAADDPVWELVAGYLVQMAATLTYTLSPQRIVLGGSVGDNGHLLARVRALLRTELAGYIGHLKDAQAIEHFLVAPGLGPWSGVLGGFALAADAAVASI